MWAKLKLPCEEEMKQGRFRLPWRSLTCPEWVTSWGRRRTRRKSRLADSWSKLCVGEHAGQVTSGKDGLFACSWFLDGVRFLRGMRCLFVPVRPDESTRSWSSAHGQSVDTPPPPEEATAEPAFATGHQQSAAAWEDTGSLTPRCTSSAAPRAVKMPTFGRVVVVSPFWQAFPSDRNKSPLTLIAKKCGRYSPLSCVCSSVCVCALCQMRRGLTSGFSQ